MIQNKFWSFSPATFIDQQLNSGVATLQPQPPPPRSSAPKSDPPQSGHLPVMNYTGLRPNPPPKRIPFRSAATDDRWNRAWSQSVAQHTGVLPQQEKRRMAQPKDAWKKHHYIYHDQVHQSVQQYMADIRDCARKDFTDFHQKDENKSQEKEIEERKIRDQEYREEVRKRMETHVFLISSMESVRTSIQTAEAEAQSVAIAIRDKDKEIQQVKGGIEDLEIEIEMLQERYKKIEEYTGILEYVPPELWETVMRNLEDTVTELKGLERLQEVDLEYIELCLHEDRGHMLLLKSVKEKLYALAELLKNLSRIIMSRTERMERLKLEKHILSQKREEHNKLLKDMNGQVKSLKDSFTALKKRDMELVQIITGSG